MKSTVLWSLVCALSAVATYQITAHYTPSIIMSIALSKLSSTNDIGENKLGHSEPITAEDRRVVRPSPDLAYSICIYNLNDTEALDITIPKRDKYLSVALYDSSTNNFFHLNDKQIEDDFATIRLIRKGIEAKKSQLSYLVEAPSNRGLVLFRAMIQTQQDLIDLEATRALMRCTKADL